ncbi:hypothetical protein K231HA_02368 [Lactococcus lactis]|nr:hypothetical protein [Lactococcus lactis]
MLVALNKLKYKYKKLKAGNFDVSYQNRTSNQGGDLKVAYQSDSPMKSQWLSGLSNDATFSTMSGPGGGQDSLFFTDVDSNL